LRMTKKLIDLDQQQFPDHKENKWTKHYWVMWTTQHPR
jgi:hypothetical protein